MLCRFKGLAVLLAILAVGCPGSVERSDAGAGGSGRFLRRVTVTAVSGQSVEAPGWEAGVPQARPMHASSWAEIPCTADADCTMEAVRCTYEGRL
jgi:hypothetical protein